MILLTDTELMKFLDCNIELTRKKVQSYQTELAGTNSGGDLGIRGNLSYQNLNLFRGAEVFNMRFTGAIEALKNRTENKYTSMKEIGAETGIIFPKVLFPFQVGKICEKIFTKDLYYQHPIIISHVPIIPVPLPTHPFRINGTARLLLRIQSGQLR